MPRRRSLILVAMLGLSVLGASLILLPAPALAVADSAFKDGASVAVPAAPPALIDSITTTLLDAPNLVLVFVQVDSTVNADRRTAPGNIEVRRGTLTTDPLISETEFRIDFARDGQQVDGMFVLLIGRDPTPGASPTYGLFMGASGTGLNAEAKFLVLNGVPNSDSEDGGSVTLTSGENTLATLSTALPNQPTVVVTAVQIDATGDEPDINAGDLRLKRGSTVLASNQFRHRMGPNGANGDGSFLLLVAEDATPGASPTYTVTATPTPPNGGRAEAKIVAFSGLSFETVDTGSVSVGTTRTVIGSVSTTFVGGDDVLIGALQFHNAGGAQATWAAGSIDIARATNLNRTANEFPFTVNDNTAFDRDYVGLLNEITTTAPNPTYEGAAQAPNNNFNMELKLVAIHVVDGNTPGCDALTVVTSDPAGQLWFNQTVEPDGVPFTTQVNVSASFQDDVTPALNVTNDGTGTCNITIRLMSDPGTGRSMKFNTTNSAPWPADTSKEVPLDPSSVTVCTAVASGGICEIWLWVDYENALGGIVSLPVRVQNG